MTEVFVSAGSNLQPHENLRRALAELAAAHPQLRASRAWLNPAVGFEGPDFINLVVAYATEQPLDAVIAELRAIEADCGRSRLAEKWQPRTMDLDLLLYGDACGRFPGAVLPRPDLTQRAYMLGPMAEIAPERVHPVLGKTYRALWQAFDQAAHPMQEVELAAADGP